ncbi:hypothetical protein [Actinoplanes couchii]|uniref:Lipoprotein n=1 Tax=Actinoplanes couchii TaxID=403638 RepID=A0ABQ3XMY0_9ACTN|nr:hypothetical protein [Actinoplanes couchii]MDR6317886.1 hypothetical protein [Actinoplanes couchii]GID59874.1 hypothetical protein Aco03nite_082780 [Actinoplanes couchii]
MSRFRQSALLPAVMAALVAGCSSPPARTPEPSAPAPVVTAATPSPGPSAAAALAPLEAPPVVPGELSRRVVTVKDGHSDNKTILHRDAKSGTEYGVQAACTSATPGTTLSVEVRRSKPGADAEPLSSGTIPCDGRVTLNGFGSLPAESIVVDLSGDRSGVTSAYAVLAPISSLMEVE